VAVGESSFKAKMKQSVGPFQVAMDLTLNVQEATPERRVLLTGGGDDGRGNMLKLHRTLLELEPLSADETQLSYRVEFTLFGKLGTFGYPVLKRKVEEMRGEFTRRIIQALTSPV
jgi:carbon monoxide dehydrogenase subunit G